MGELYFTTGKIIVKPRGYWYTSGGEKGSFGYYPHLKEGDLPVYPDTQIHGDLRMAVTWLLNLKGADSKEVSYYFGDSPDLFYRQTRSKVFVTDLRLNKGGRFCFQIKPRTEIDEDRTNRENMLVNFELAYYEDAALEASIYLAYFDNLQKLKELVSLLKEAVNLLSGFGGFRSRGYGRGLVKIEFEKPKAVKIDNSHKPDLQNGELTIILKPLTKLRNRKIEGGRRQLVDTSFYVSSSQIRGWFLKAYKDLVDKWPSAEEMKLIRFTDFYPSLYNPKTNLCQLGFPASVTSVKFKDGSLSDLWKNQPEETEKGKKQRREKPKPLGQRYFVTNEEEPKVIQIKTDFRIRNSIEANFTTKKEGGLFTQEFITEENYFGGKIFLEGEGDFVRNALMILKNPDLKPIINGTIFEKIICNEAKTQKSASSDTFLVVSPVTVDEKILLTLTQERDYNVKLSTIRRYAIELRRPRRNRIVIDNGSVYPHEVEGKTIRWLGFGKDLRQGG